MVFPPSYSPCLDRDRAWTGRSACNRSQTSNTPLAACNLITGESRRRRGVDRLLEERSTVPKASRS